VALCPGARSGDANVVTDVFAGTKLSGVARKADYRPLTGHGRRGPQTPTECWASRREVQLKHDQQNSDDMETGRIDVGHDIRVSDSGADQGQAWVGVRGRRRTEGRIGRRSDRPPNTACTRLALVRRMRASG
jgi:hypothetical protein